jgi:N,N'-diacetylchitobiose transport system substrate-binding protein
MEYGNTDTAGYVKDGGLLDVTGEFTGWSEAKDTNPTARTSVTVPGKVYGSPFNVGVRALYYWTGVFKELGLAVPRTMAELAVIARKIRAAKPELYGLVVGGAYTYGAMPFIWANGGELATGKGGSYASAISGAPARKGVKEYTSLFTDDNCPAAECAAYQQAFASSQYSLGSAIGVVTLLILLAVTLVYLRLLHRQGEER